MLNGDERKQETGPADRGLRLRARPGSILRYRVLTEDGTVAFGDNALRQPPAFYRVAKLTRDVARGPCSLRR
jgi:hypothetical protein